MSIATAPPPAPPMLRLEDPPEPPEERLRPRRSGPDDVISLVGAAISAFSLVWLVFEWLTPMSGGLGFWLCWYVAFLGLYATVTHQRRGRLVMKDRIATVLLTTTALCLFVPMTFIVGYTIYKGYHALRPTFFTEDQRYTASLSKATEGGGLHAIIGTLEQVGLATIFSVPLGVSTAVFLSEIGGRLARPVRLVVDTMTAIPTIVAGLFIFATIVLTFGQSGLAGALALAVLMLPTVTKTAEMVLKLVPGGLREASLALGGSQWRTTRSVVLPTARSGLATAVILGIARAIGETAPLLLTIGGAFIVNADPLHGKQDALPFFVWRLIKFPQEAQQMRAWTGALVLLALVLVLFTTARAIGGRGAGHIGRISRWRQRRLYAQTEDIS
jgi:phosphate transport system permease protein